MRLICPNCAAEYEVDASMIPEDGRDVQCSSCGHTWFQRPDTAEESLAEEMGVTAPDPAFAAEEPEDEPETEDEVPAPVAAAPKARQLDEATRDILREEARREAEARRREAAGKGGLESQPELGLTDPEGAQSRADAAKARLARLRDTPEEATEQDAQEATVAATVSASTAASSRRELLPDIEEINSTLTATGDRQSVDAFDDEEQVAESRRGFRFGFFTVFLIIGALILLYLFAPQLAEAVPSLAPALTAYLNWANGMLDLIDEGLRQGVAAMQGLINGSPEG